MTRLRSGPRPSPASLPESGSVLAAVTRVASRAMYVAALAGGVWLLTSLAAHAAHASGASATGSAPATGSTSASGSATVSGAPAGTGSGVAAGMPSNPDGAGVAGTAARPTGIGALGLVTQPVSRLLAGLLGPAKTVAATTATPASAGDAIRDRVAAPAEGSTPAATSQVASPELSRRPVAARTGAGLLSGSADLARAVGGLIAPLGLTELAGSSLDLFRPMIGIADSSLLSMPDPCHPYRALQQAMLASRAGGPGSVSQQVTVLGLRSTAGPVGHPTSATRHRSVAGTTTGNPVGSGRAAPEHTGAQVDSPGTPAVPGSPSPAPMPANPGSGSIGTSTTASGSHPGDGSLAVAPVPVASGHVDGHCRAGAVDVGVRRLIAEIPTFAPD